MKTENRILRRMLSFALALLLIIMIFPTAVFAESGESEVEPLPAEETQEEEPEEEENYTQETEEIPDTAAMTVLENLSGLSILSRNGKESLALGESLKLYVTDSSGAERTGFVWVSLDPGIADVDQNGNLKTVSAGTATIRATNPDNPDEMAEIEITVNLPVSDTPEIDEDYWVPMYYTKAYSAFSDRTLVRSSLISTIRTYLNGRNLTIWDSSAAFITNCAQKAGMINSGLFPKTDSTEELYRFFHDDFQVEEQSLASVFPEENSETISGTGNSSEEESYLGALVFFSEAKTEQEVSARQKAQSESNDAEETEVFPWGSCGIIIETAENTVTLAVISEDGKLCREQIDRETAEQTENAAVLKIRYRTNSEMTLWFLRKYSSFSDAALAGIMANIYWESAFDFSSVGDRGTSFGLCQWHEERWTGLKDFAAANKADMNSIEIQVRYLIHELNSSYTSVRQVLLKAPNQAHGAYLCAYKFCYDFEQPKSRETGAWLRGNLAGGTYWNLVRNTK